MALAGIFGGDFLLLRLSSFVVVLTSVAISYFSSRRGASLYLTAILIALSFFLLSQKVVGYYYVIPLPFALVAFLPARRFGVLTLLVASTAWISLSPYFASWANPSHLPVYAVLGVANSLLWFALFIYLWRGLPSLPLQNVEKAANTSPLQMGQAADRPLLQMQGQAATALLLQKQGQAATALLLQKQGQAANAPLLQMGQAAIAPLLQKEGQGEVKVNALAFLSVALFIEAVAAALLQPLVNNPTSPIRAPIVPPGLESNVLYASIAFVVIILAVFIFAVALTRIPEASRGAFQNRPYLSLGVFAIALVLAPVYFLTFTCTKESTAFVEIALKSLGL